MDLKFLLYAVTRSAPSMVNMIMFSVESKMDSSLALCVFAWASCKRMSVMSRKMPRTLLGFPLESFCTLAPPSMVSTWPSAATNFRSSRAPSSAFIQVLPRLGSPCITSCTVRFDNSMAEYPKSLLNDGLTYVKYPWSSKVKIASFAPSKMFL